MIGNLGRRSLSLSTKVGKRKMPFRNLNASEVAEPFREETQKAISALPFKPLLVGFLATDDKASRAYANWTKKSCQDVGIEFEVRECLPYDLEGRLDDANKDPNVHGIIIYYPCFGMVPSFFGGSMDDHLRDSISCEKDVEGLNATYRNNLYRNVRFLPKLTLATGGNVPSTPAVSEKQCVLPCTPLAIVKILEYLKVYDEQLPVGEKLKGKTVTIINRSEIVGRPLAAMLANDGADCYSVDIDSIYLMQRGKMLPPPEGIDVEQAVRQSDVVVLGVPSKAYKLNPDWIKDGTVVLNVSHFKNVDEEALKEKDDITYVGQVGKVTVAMLERNLIRLIKNFHLPGCNEKVIELGGCVVPK